MSSLSKFIKSQKEKDLKFFFGDDVKNTSNKYFKFRHVVSDEQIIIITKNVKSIKGEPVLIVAKNKGVYLKEWQVRRVRNYDLEVEAFAVKLNKNYFKPYIFKFDFEDMFFDEEDTFESLAKVAAEQDIENMEVAQGWGN
jgi:hypothetical protein